MLPPYLLNLPKGSVRIAAWRLSVGDFVYLDTASSGDLVRSLIVGIRNGRFYSVMNRLHPEPYEVYLSDTREVVAVKMKPSTRRAPNSDFQDGRDWNNRDPGHRYTYTQPSSPPADEDFRSYWNWDPSDPRAAQEYHAVEEREWRRLTDWERKAKTKKKKTSRKKPRPKIDSKLRQWYEVLGIRAGAGPKALKKAFKEAAFRFHPDRCKDLGAEEMFKKIGAAYEGLNLLFKKKP